MAQSEWSYIIMNEQDLRVVEAMERYGGSFVVALAKCARKADSLNLKKLKDTFSMYWEQYTELSRLNI